jgi:hypothetical protein
MRKLADLRWRQTRKRKPYLVGRVGDFWITLVQVESKDLSGIAATLWISPARVEAADEAAQRSGGDE